MTPIGILTAAIALLLLIRAPHRLWEFAILTTPFQASTLIELSSSSREAGLAPVYLILAVACVYELWQWLGIAALPRAVMGVTTPAICFLAWGVVSAFAIPAFFKGGLVVAPYSIYMLSRLEPSFSNVTHCLYLSLLVASMALLALHVQRMGPSRVPSLLRAYEAAVWTSAAIIVWHQLSLYLGLPYPSEFLYNHPGVVHYEGNGIRPELALASGILRASGPFSESSIAAAYLGGGFGLAVAKLVYVRRGVRPMLKCLLLGAITLSVISTSSVVILAATLLFYSISSLKTKRLRQAGIRLLALCLLLLAIPLSILLVSEQARDEAELAVNYLLLNKFDSTTDASFRSRTVIERNAVDVFENSYGMGAGLGSNVAFTMPGYIASSTGTIGLGLCAWFARRLWRAYRRAVLQNGIRELGGAATGLMIGGLAGSHQLVFVPIWYLVLGTLIAASCSASLSAPPRRLTQAAKYPTQLQPGLWEPL